MSTQKTVIYYSSTETNLGHTLAAKSSAGLCFLAIGGKAETLLKDLHKRFPAAEILSDHAELEEILTVIGSYISGPAKDFNHALDIQGTEFQKLVWKELTNIPAGHTITYSELAKRIGRPTSVRAVANACGANPVAVLIPCHRVIRRDGSLGGYRWGLEKKKILLASEQSHAQ